MRITWTAFVIIITVFVAVCTGCSRDTRDFDSAIYAAREKLIHIHIARKVSYAKACRKIRYHDENSSVSVTCSVKNPDHAGTTTLKFRAVSMLDGASMCFGNDLVFRVRGEGMEHIKTPNVFFVEEK